MAGRPVGQDTRSLVLSILARGEAYGYEVAVELLRLDAEANLVEGAVYPVLWRLENDGLVSGHWVDIGADVPRRRYYVATPKGLAVLNCQGATKAAPKRRVFGQVQP
jgi:PadR family transcriptional regulator PadR